jgi:regulator of sirC expression with transglutaminase-like and TPR domain
VTPLRHQLTRILEASEPDVVLCALLLEQEERPHLDPAKTLREVDLWAARIEKRLGGARAPMALAEAIADLLFVELGFRPNRENYYQPQNSYMSDVVERRLGIPISLSLLYLGIGVRLGVEMAGIGFPGHFLLRIGDEKRGVLADPFGEGRVLDKAAAEALLRQFRGSDAKLEPSHLAALSPRSTLARMQRNLKLIYLREESWQLALDATDRVIFLEPEIADEYRDRGLIYERLECFSAASKDFQTYLNARPDAEDASHIYERLTEVNGRVALFH